MQLKRIQYQYNFGYKVCLIVARVNAGDHSTDRSVRPISDGQTRF